MEDRTTPVAAETGANFTATHLGPLDQLARYRYTIPAHLPFAGKQVRGKAFLKDVLALTGVEISMNTLPSGAGMPFLHKHREHEEVYLFLSGSGEFMVDGTVFPIAEGSVVRVATDGVRAYRNTGSTSLQFIVLQVKEGSLAVGTSDDGVALDKPVQWPATAN